MLCITFEMHSIINPKNTTTSIHFHIQKYINHKIKPLISQTKKDHQKAVPLKTQSSPQLRAPPLSHTNTSQQ